MIEFVTASGLATQLGMANPDAYATAVATAVNVYLSRFDWLTKLDELSRFQPTETAQLGALMLAVRLYRRQNSPGGLEPLGDGGVAYVARTDPDVDRLLELGAYATPKVG